MQFRNLQVIKVFGFKNKSESEKDDENNAEAKVFVK